MTCTNADFVFSADHAVTLYAKLFNAIVELCAQGCHNDFLSRSHIWRTANDLTWFCLTDIDCAYMHVVGVWMRLTGEDLSDNKSFKSAFDGFYFFNTANFQAY